MAKDIRAKAYVRDFLATTCAVTLAELEPRNDQPTADFKMVDAGEHVLFAELKTLEYQEPSEQAGWTIERDEDGHGYQAWRTAHNGPARIMKKVGEAYRQLSAHPHPWAVILHNADRRTDVRDLFEAFSGERVVGVIEGRRLIMTNSRKIALGKTYPTRYEIDLFIWVDQEECKRRLGVWWSTSVGEEIGRRYFTAAEGQF